MTLASSFVQALPHVDKFHQHFWSNVNKKASLAEGSSFFAVRKKISVQIMGFQFLSCTHTCIDFYSSIQLRLSDLVFLSLNMYECFMNTKCLCSCLKRYYADLSLKQGYKKAKVSKHRQKVGPVNVWDTF